ncbi:hypothetical protein ACROSR_04075 [Roseovarius tibetensis]
MDDQADQSSDESETQGSASEDDHGLHTTRNDGPDRQRFDDFAMI